MAVVQPFRAWHYNSKKIKQLSEVVAPPYDVISDNELTILQRINPYNFSKIILAKGPDKHVGAASLFHEWVRNEIFIKDTLPSLYFYKQEFKLDRYELFCQEVDEKVRQGSRLSRVGIFALVGLADYSSKKILPHEKTFSGPKADRYQLMEAVQGNMEPVFLGYDSDRFSGDEFQGLVSNLEPSHHFSDLSGVEHTLWAVSAPETHTQVAKALTDETFYILDGHHRYETALQFYKDYGSTVSQSLVLADICSFRQQGTIILPTHRLVRGVKNLNPSNLLKRLSSHFEVVPVDSPRELEILLMQNGLGCFGFLMGGRSQYSLLKLRDDVGIGGHLKLDLDILHEFVLGQLLEPGSQQSVADLDLAYVKSIPEVEMRLNTREYQFGFLVRPSSYDQVIRSAQNLEKMPHKSTFFHPKIPSGLVVNLFE